MRRTAFFRVHNKILVHKIIQNSTDSTGTRQWKIVTFSRNSNVKLFNLFTIRFKYSFHYLIHRSLIDLNRAGIPLIEIVFEPDLSTGEEAASLLHDLRKILEIIGVCSGNMSQGAMRCDANISIHKKGEPLGIRTEVKNVATIRGVAKAIDYEINRQIQLVQNGKSVINETRSWDPESGTTVAMRDKEVVQDYRFMPEPCLPPLKTDVSNLIEIRKSFPELPNETRAYLGKFNLQPHVIQMITVKSIRDILSIASLIIFMFIETSELVEFVQVHWE